MQIRHAAYIAIVVHFARKCAGKLYNPPRKKDKYQELLEAIQNASKNLAMQHASEYIDMSKMYPDIIDTKQVDTSWSTIPRGRNKYA